MEFEALRIIAQWILYAGLFVVLIGSIGVSVHNNKTEKTENQKQIKNEGKIKRKIRETININVFNYMSYVGACLVFIGTVSVDIYTSKIEESENEKRSATEQENKLNSEKILNLSSFYSELDNPLESLFLVIRLKGNYRLRDLNGFECFVKIKALDRKYRFSIYWDNQNQKNSLFIDSYSAEGDDWVQKFDQTSVAEFRLDSTDLFLELLPITLLREYKDIVLRDLNKTYFQIIVSSQQTNMIERFFLNANDWNIFEAKTLQNNWKSAYENWIDTTRSSLSTFYIVHKTKHFTANRIEFYKDTITRKHINKNPYSDSLTGSNDYVEVLRNIDPEVGTLEFEIDNSWLKKDGIYLNYINNLRRGKFQLDVFKDKDNFLKVRISTGHFSGVLLTCRDTRPFPVTQNFHNLVITWSKKALHLYINGKEVDKKEKL